MDLRMAPSWPRHGNSWLFMARLSPERFPPQDRASLSPDRGWRHPVQTFPRQDLRREGHSEAQHRVCHRPWDNGGAPAVRRARRRVAAAAPSVMKATRAVPPAITTAISSEVTSRGSPRAPGAAARDCSGPIGRRETSAHAHTVRQFRVARARPRSTMPLVPRCRGVRSAASLRSRPRSAAGVRASVPSL